MVKAKLAVLLAGMLLAGQVFGTYSCTVSPTSTWGNGYQLDVTVTNDGPGSISGWTVQLNFSEPANVTSSWNVTVSGGSTATPSFTNCCNWNGHLSSGQSTSFGFQGAHDGSFNVPTCNAVATSL